MPTLKISSEQDGKRLDVILARAYPDHSRVFLQKWIKEGQVTLVGQEATPSYRVKAGETINVSDFNKSSTRYYFPKTEISKTSTKVVPGTTFAPSILFEDKSILVLNKPANLVVHPAPSHKGPTLVDWLEDYLGPKVTGLFSDTTRLGVVHRLDKDTTGVLLVAKTVVAQNLISKQFQDRKVKKTYVAFIEGIPRAKTGIISAPVGRSHKTPSRMAVSSSGRPSETSFEVVDTYKEVSQVRLQPKTGRTHQIRVHCAAIGHPIVGDQTYGSSSKWLKEFGIQRTLLHAESLELEHPATHKKISFKAPWPQDMKKAEALFRASMKVAVLALSLMLGTVSARAAESDSTAAAPAQPKVAHTSTKAGSQVYSSIKALKNETASLHEQFKSLIEEVSALQDRVTAIQSSLDELDASRRLRDLEKAISDLNGKSVNNGNVAEESKSEVLDLSHKLKAQQDALDQLQDQFDRLQKELIEAKAHADEAMPPAAAPAK